MDDSFSGEYFVNYSPRASLGASRHALSKQPLSVCRSQSQNCPVVAHTIDVLLDTGKVNGLDTTDLLLRDTSQSRTSSSDSTSGAPGSDVGALGNAGRNQLTGNWCPQGLGESS